MYLEAEIPVEKLPTCDTRQWVESKEYVLREMFAPFKGSLVSVGIDDSVVYIHIYLDDELNDDEITDNGICLKKFLEHEEHIEIDHDYVTE